MPSVPESPAEQTVETWQFGRHTMFHCWLVLFGPGCFALCYSEMNMVAASARPSHSPTKYVMMHGTQENIQGGPPHSGHVVCITLDAQYEDRIKMEMRCG